MKKKISRFVLSVCAVAFFASLLVFQSSAEEFTDGNFIYTLSDGLAFITGTVQPVSGELIVPDTVSGPVEQLPSTSEPGAQTPPQEPDDPQQGTDPGTAEPEAPDTGVPEPERYTVVGISDGAFSGQTGITSAVLPSTVTYVGASAFSGCTAMASLSAPGLAQVSNSAFEGCSALSQFDFGRISSVGASAFRGCAFTSISLPDGMSLLGDGAFAGCSALVAVTFAGAAPASVGAGPFDGAAEGFTVNIMQGAQGFELQTAEDGSVSWLGYRVVQTHEHTFGEWTVVTPATCTADGSQTRACSCGYTETQTLPALGHQWSEWTHDEALSQSMGAAWNRRTCSRCGATETAAAGSEPQTPSVEDPHEHSWSEWRIEREPTASHAGSEIRTCSICGLQEVRSIVLADNIEDPVTRDFIVDALSDDGYAVTDTDGNVVFYISLLNVSDIVIDRYCSYSAADVRDLINEAYSAVSSCVRNTLSSQDKQTVDALMSINPGVNYVALSFGVDMSFDYNIILPVVFDSSAFNSDELHVYRFDRDSGGFEHVSSDTSSDSDGYTVSFRFNSTGVFLVTDALLSGSGAPQTPQTSEPQTPTLPSDGEPTEQSKGWLANLMEEWGLDATYWYCVLGMCGLVALFYAARFLIPYFIRKRSAAAGDGKEQSDADGNLSDEASADGDMELSDNTESPQPKSVRRRDPDGGSGLLDRIRGTRRSGRRRSPDRRRRD